MEEKKLDINSIIGFVLIFGILIYWFYANQPSAEEVEARRQAAEQVQDSLARLQQAEAPSAEITFPSDSVARQAYGQQAGAFGYSEPREGVTTLENELLELQVANRGGQISLARLKSYVTFDSVPVYLIKDKNASFVLLLTTSDNRVLHTRDLYFQPSLKREGEVQKLSMKAMAGPDSYLEFLYTMRPGEYMVGFDIRSQGLSGILSGEGVPLAWDLTGIRHSKSVEYENRYTRLTYRHEGSTISKLGATGEDDETEIGVRWISYRQHFFSSILAADQPFASAVLTSKDLVTEESPGVRSVKTSGRVPNCP